MENNTDSDRGDGKDSRGLFAKGNKLGHGNPYVKRCIELREKFAKCATVKDFKIAYRALFEKVKAGDVAAIKIYFEYAIGKPKQEMEISAPENQAITWAAVAEIVKVQDAASS